MHCLRSLLPTVTCYSDGISIHSTSPQDLQILLHAFYASSTGCGLIISPEKSRIFVCNLRALPNSLWVGMLSLTAHSICTWAHQSESPPTYFQDNEFTPLLKYLDRLQHCVLPVKGLTNNASFPIARTPYMLFLQSVVDYLSPALCQLPRKALEPLEKFQNRVMRFIQGCPLSTRIVNMKTELKLPPLDRIYANITYFC